MYECGECKEYGEKYRGLTRYANTTFIKYDPPHFEKWQCPKHPGVKAIHVDEYIEDMLSSKQFRLKSWSAYPLNIDM